MGLVSVAGQAFSKIQVQGQAVEVVLQEIISGQHALLYFFKAVVFDAGAKVIGFPVGKIEFSFKLKNKIYKSPHKATGRSKGQSVKLEVHVSCCFADRLALSVATFAPT